MHKMHHEPTTISGPETSGAVLHQVGQYDICASLLGTGVNRSNSRMIVEMAKVKPGDRVLDVGCGTGSLTLTAKNYAGISGSAYGIDASPEMIEAGFQDIDSGPTRSAFLAFASGRKPKG